MKLHAKLMNNYLDLKNYLKLLISAPFKNYIYYLNIN